MCVLHFGFGMKYGKFTIQLIQQRENKTQSYKQPFKAIEHQRRVHYRFI